MDDPDSPAGAGGGGTPRKSLWRSASWCARSPRAPIPADGTSTGGASALARQRPAPLHLPPLSTSRCTRAWPLLAAADSCSTSSPAASSLVDGDLSLVADHIYLGGDSAARDRVLLRRHGITHVLNCAGFTCPQRFDGEFTYRTLWLRDHPGEDIASLLYDVFDFLEEVRARGRVLVHCARGTSRSAALVVAYLMWNRAISFDDAINLVRDARPAADPNPGFVAQLLHWQRRVLPLSPLDRPPCVYRMAPHSPYDPLHLVPKMVDRSGPAELDSRGAFIVHAPSLGRDTVYLWVGEQSELAMTSSAGAAARQVLRYERARGPIMTIEEGSEPAEFWEALGYPAAPDDRGLTSSVRRKRVDSYDLDFEIYRRALRGGPAIPAAKSPSPSPDLQSITTGVATGPTSNSETDAAIPFGSPRSFSGGSVTPTSSDASTFFTYSPASSSSDWFDPSPGSDLSYGEASLLRSPRPLPLSPSRVNVRSAGTTPSLVLRANIGGDDNADVVGEWPFSPYPLELEEKDRAMDIDQETPSGLGKAVKLERETLYRWLPSVQKVEELHPGVLDSESVFLLLAPKMSLNYGEPKTLFVWIGKNYRLSHGVHVHRLGGGEEVEGAQAFFKNIGANFLKQMTLPVDTPIQVIREDKEPEEFLNHLFTFHQTNDSSKR